MATETCTGRVARYRRREFRKSIAEMEATFGKRRLEVEQPHHLPTVAAGIDEPRPENHVATALAMHRPRLGKGFQRAPEPARRGEFFSVQLGIAARQPADRKSV